MIPFLLGAITALAAVVLVLFLLARGMDKGWTVMREREPRQEVTGPACKVYGATPNAYGVRRHGKGCFQISEDGGGEDYFNREGL